MTQAQEALAVKGLNMSQKSLWNTYSYKGQYGDCKRTVGLRWPPHADQHWLNRHQPHTAVTDEVCGILAALTCRPTPAESSPTPTIPLWQTRSVGFWQPHMQTNTGWIDTNFEHSAVSQRLWVDDSSWPAKTLKVRILPNFWLFADWINHTITW